MDQSELLTRQEEYSLTTQDHLTHANSDCAVKSGHQQVTYPAILRFNLMLLGYCDLFNYYRKCFRCHENDSSTENPFDDTLHEPEEPGSESENTGGTDKDCHVCISLHKGAFVKPGRMREMSRKGYLTLFWMIVVELLLVTSIISNIIRRWGRQEAVLYMLSYTLYLLPPTVVTTVLLVAVFLPLPTAGENGALYALPRDHVLSQLPYLSKRMRLASKYAYIFTTFGVFWGLAIFSFNLVSVFLAEECESIDYLICFHVVSEVIGMFYFIIFCYLIFVLRNCLEINMVTTLAFLKSNIRGIDGCRARIMETHTDFLRLHTFSSRWIVFQMVVAVFHCYCHVHWNYKIFLWENANFKAIFVNFSVWVEIILFSLLPLIAVNGFDIMEVWDKFAYNIQRIRKSSDEESWAVLQKTIRHITPEKTSIIMTVVFSTLSLFFALQLSGQYAEYWNEGSICKANSTALY
ncbi:uncharacterized protein [Ptychodera flava]|uniref:uncharacterized protein n=1 Tax=Ptychodera flava TaxID=63121 RepID=UPI00396A7D03